MNKLLVLGFLMIVSTAAATQQESEPVKWKGETYYPLFGPGMPWNSSPNTPRRHFDLDSTANYKGYHATWEIKDGVLYLDSFEAREHGKRVGIRQIFPGRKPPIKADWYSESIDLPQGKSIGTDLDFKPVYAKELWLHFKDGKLIRTEMKAGDARQVMR